MKIEKEELRQSYMDHYIHKSKDSQYSALRDTLSLMQSIKDNS